MKSRIIILGSKGMLGQMVKLYFTNEKYEVIIFNKRFSENNFISYIDELNSIQDGIVINCIGRIKQKSEEAFDLLWANSIFPLSLARSLKSSHILIQPSTDCVFDGHTNISYNILDTHTASDIYGWSKSLGETAILGRSNSLIIRVSIIGPDNYSNKGLLAWFLNNPSGNTLNGFTNHFWNGITTLEWCKRLHEIISDNKLLIKYLKKGIVQIGTVKTYSKFEMLNLFNKIFNTDFQINPTESDYINRCLMPEIKTKSLEFQLKELKHFYYK